MVNVMIVCREWLEVINDNRSLWRRLVLPESRSGKGWELSTIELFDRKSNSTLKEISMHLNMSQHVSVLMDLLKRSEGSLRALCLSGAFSSKEENLLSELCWRLSSLTSFRVIRHHRPSNVNLIEKEVSEGEGEQFKILWVITIESLEQVFSKDPHRFDHLVSLKIQHRIDDPKSMAIVKQSSRALKHLSIKINDNHIGIPQDQFSTTIELPLLEVLEFVNSANRFPKWLKIPKSCTIIHLHPRLLYKLPPCSELWIDGLHSIDRLANMCPNLVELRVFAINSGLKREECDTLVDMLIERNKKVDERMGIDGVRMVRLKRVIFPFGYLKRGRLSQLRELVEEVVDLKFPETFIEVEV